MKSKEKARFAALVQAAQEVRGARGPDVIDEILKTNYRDLIELAEKYELEDALRRGLIEKAKMLMRAPKADQAPSQKFLDLREPVREAINRLGSDSFLVPDDTGFTAGEYVPVVDLCYDQARFKEAVRHMDTKAAELAEEAERLTVVYFEQFGEAPS